MDSNSSKLQPELPEWLTEYIRNQLLPEYFPKGITPNNLKDIEFVFEVKRMMDSVEDLPPKIPIELLRDKAMKIDADELEAIQILELGRVLQRLDRLAMAEMVDDVERKKLLGQITSLENLATKDKND